MKEIQAGDRIIGVGVIVQDWRSAGIERVTVLDVRESSNVCRVEIESVYGHKSEESWNLVHVLNSIPRFYRIERPTWSGSPCPLDPDNYWIDDKTGERVNAKTGERTPPDVRKLLAMAKPYCPVDVQEKIEAVLSLGTTAHTPLVVPNPDASYHIRSRDNYYLTENRCWTARKPRRVLLSFQDALREIEEARKWNPSAEIHPES